MLVSSLPTIAFCTWFPFKFAASSCIVFNRGEPITPYQSCCGLSMKEQKQEESSHAAELNSAELA